MWKTEDELRRDLEDAFAPDRTEAEFLASLREGLAADDGGEHEVSVAVDRRAIRRTVLGLAAAAGLLLAFLVAPRGEPDGLPGATTAAAPKGNLPLRVHADGGIEMGGETAKSSGIFALIGKVVAERRKAGAEKLVASIEAKRTTRWQAVHDVLKGLARVEVPAELVVTDGESKERRALPVPPLHDPAAGEAKGRVTRIVLSRGMDETATWLMVNGVLCRELADAGPRERDLLLPLFALETPYRLEAGASVPLAQVVRVIDVLRGTRRPVRSLSRDAPAYFTVMVSLMRDGKERRIHLPWIPVTLPLYEGLKELETRIDLMKRAGRKVHGFVQSRVHLGPEPLEKVLAVYRKMGVEDVPVLH